MLTSKEVLWVIEAVTGAAKETDEGREILRKLHVQLDMARLRERAVRKMKGEES